LIIKVQVFKFENTNFEVVLATHEPSYVKEFVTGALDNLSGLTDEEDDSGPLR
jgi:Zn-dependent M28 family amino/carboxypeptidase